MLLNKVITEISKGDITKAIDTSYRLYNILRIYKTNEKDTKRIQTVDGLLDLINDLRAIFVG